MADSINGWSTQSTSNKDVCTSNHMKFHTESNMFRIRACKFLTPTVSWIVANCYEIDVQNTMPISLKVTHGHERWSVESGQSLLTTGLTQVGLNDTSKLSWATNNILLHSQEHLTALKCNTNENDLKSSQFACISSAWGLANFTREHFPQLVNKISKAK